MSNTSVKIAIGLCMVLTPPAASFARGGLNNSTVDPSGVGMAAGVAPLPQPHIAAAARPVGSRSPVEPPSMNSDQQLLPEAPVGHRQPRADQVPSEKNLMNPNDPMNQDNAAVDRTINGICRGC